MKTTTTQTTPQLTHFYPANTRGATKLSWLHGHHIFNFGGFFDPTRAGFEELLVLNDDLIAPATGFSPHPHRHMEILSLVLSGTLSHQDSTGMAGDIPPYNTQLMSVGEHVIHSEMNKSPNIPVRLLQIWIRPKVMKKESQYYEGQPELLKNQDGTQLYALASQNHGGLPLLQDAALFYLKGTKNSYATVAEGLPSGQTFLYVAKGQVSFLGHTCNEGDALSFVGNVSHLQFQQDSEILVYSSTKESLS